MGHLDLTHPERLRLLRARDGNIIAELAPLWIEDYRRFEEGCKPLTSFRNWVEVFPYVEANLRELDEAMASAATTSEADWSSDALQTHYFQINRRLLNFLAAARTFLDYTETKIKREYGNTSDEATRFLTAASAAYDRTFAYRFLIRLRNFAQHCGLPVGHIEHTRTERRAAATVRTVLRLAFDVDSLLSEFDRWNTVAPELETMRPRVWLDKQPHQFADELRGLNELAIEIFRPRLVDAATAIMSVLEPGFRTARTETVVGQSLSADEYHWEIPPYDMMERVGTPGLDATAA